MAHHQLAHRHERKAQGSFRRCPGAGRRRTTTADQGQGPTTSARRRGLAHRRTQDVGREEVLGLDHFERRSWQGLHRHALMTMIAYAFLQHRRLATARREKKNQWAAASANFARRTPRHSRTLRSTTAAAMPALSNMDLQRAAA